MFKLPIVDRIAGLPNMIYPMLFVKIPSPIIIRPTPHQMWCD